MDYPGEMKETMDRLAEERRQKAINDRCFEARFDDMMFRDIMSRMYAGKLTPVKKEGIGGA